ncbi:TrkH family potassium uptake protein [Caldinitratiruptor microaerophilus]|uniref:K+ transporter Trk n=1 Tax=Caldinitratiruptor microaerophilus TaxID=671077 RepID=A0AA35CLR0_9FIRM|nr:TrkH family potassium uptake protein [Caldinitratiruptor microaerophilus]BDG60834.1 K+ transporter Trk [Caldinitratiruptor microaerophilus]
MRLGLPVLAARRRHVLFSPARVLVTGFALLILVGTVLLSLPVSSATGQSVGVVNALFTATSAVCVTGLVVLDTAGDFSLFGQIVILSLIQIGGLGITVLSVAVALILGRRVSLRERVVLQEAFGQWAPAGMVRLVQEVLKVTVVIEGTGALILFLRFLGDYPPLRAAWLAVFHAISAFANAGFDLFHVSLKPFATDPVVVLTVAALLMVGGIGFTVIQDLRRTRLHWHRLSLHSRMALATTACLVAGGFAAVLALEWSNPKTLGALPPLARPLAAFFTAVTPRTAGFEVIPTGELRPVTLLLVIALMYIGASPGGTGGGIKTTTFATVVLTIRAAVRGWEDVHVWGRRLPNDLLRKAWVIAAIAAGWVLLVTATLLVTEGRDLTPILFETTSAFGTVGLSTGITPDLTTAGKLLIALMMYTGRVGPLTLAVALAERRAPAPDVQFPDERVMIG